MDRIVMHIDMNSYFASVEQQANPFLRGRPIGVSGKSFDPGRADQAQRTIIATASIEAKKLGIKTAMSTWEAKRILPSLIIIPGDPEKYSEITHRFNDLLHEFSDQVEVFSVDESFVDLTAAAQDYFGATMLAQAIRERLREECGEVITASIGIAPNKLVAKLASESHKPNGLTVVRPEEVLEFVASRDLEDFCGIGPRIRRRLENLGIFDVQQLRAYPLEGLLEEFKSYGHWLHEAAFGRDASPVSADEEPPKSVGHSYTLPRDISDPLEVKRQLLALADKVAWRLRRDGFVARSVSVYVRFSDLGGFGREHRFREPTADGAKLAEIAWRLITPPFQGGVGGGWDGRLIRLIGISASQLSRGPEQTPLFKKEQRLLFATSALDRIQTRYGSKAWTRASLLGVEFRARSSGWHYDHEL